MKHNFRDPTLARMAAVAKKWDAQMGLLDAQNQYSDAQALVATAVSTNVIDHGSDRDLGIGEPLVVQVTIDVTSVGGGTLQVTLQSDTVVGFGTAVTVAQTGAIAAAAVIAGARILLAMPADKTMARFSRLNYTMVTMTNVTVTSLLIPLRSVQAENVFASGFAVL